MMAVDKLLSPAMLLLLITVLSLTSVPTAAEVCGGCRRSFVKCYMPQPICPPPDEPCCDGFIQDGDICKYDASVLDEQLGVTAECEKAPPIPQGVPRAYENEAVQNIEIFLNNIERPMSTTSKNSNIAPNIINGKFAEHGQFPWQIVLAHNGFFICGGTIISPWWVVTAAHCVEGKSATDLQALAGVQHLFSFDTGQVAKGVTDIVIHGRYKFPFADIALLKMSTPFTWTSFVQPACLPRECDTQNAHAIDDVTYTISGHGAINPEGDVISDQLQYAEVVIKNRNRCGRVYGNKVFKNVLCVDGIEGDYSGSCRGDSGGPLTYNNVLLGVTSFGAQTCGTYPFGYTHVSRYLTWMRVQMAKKKYQ